VNEQYNHSSIVIQWRLPYQAYIVTVPELTGCKTHGDTYEEAIKNGQEVIELCIDALKASGKAIPAPRVLVS